MVTALPRLVIAAPASGHGKTTVATGLMAALVRAGHTVSGHKVGPDYIDPGYHALATGRPGRNLDPHLVGEQRLVPLLLHGALTPKPADIAVIEGVMGLFDGAIGGEGFASTAHVAAVLGAPVVLVVDISAASRTIAALVHGLAGFDTSIRIGGVVLNKAGSPRHAGEVISALESTGIPVLGTLYRDDGIAAPARHLGLVPVSERADATAALQRLAEQIAAGVDLGGILRIARSAPDLTEAPWDAAAELGELSAFSPAATVAIGGGRAFTFRYAETEELLRAAGVEPVVFDPIDDTALPGGTAGIYLGGGFPEMHAGGLAGNRAMRESLWRHIDSGVPTVAECAGLLYLCHTLDGSEMVGVIPAAATMTPRLSLSYRTVVAPADTLLAAAGTRVTGHEFHRTTVNPAAGTPAWIWDGQSDGYSADPAGLGAPTLHASYLHTHWAGYPHLAATFAAAARGFVQRPDLVASAPARRPARFASRVPASGEYPAGLRHHGDDDIAPGLVDLAVNVRVARPPEWLADRLRTAVDRLAPYPKGGRAVAAISRRHGRREDEVLPTAGGAEAFTLVARALRPRHAVVVGPQFTEPEAALLAAGHRVRRVNLSAADGFTLTAEQVPVAADLVMIGNPTNPTGVLHPAAVLTGLIRPGRSLVIDEAFMDAVAGEAQSLAARVLPGLLVLRSLTKTWGIAGLRAGYVVGDHELIARLREQQPHWSVSSLALEAIEACLTPDALAEADRAANALPAQRTVLTDGLAELGLPAVGSPRTPFVLVDTSPVAPADEVRLALRDKGFAVRRGDTFPGLGPGWIRIAVREPAVTRRLLTALEQVIIQLRNPSPADHRAESLPVEQENRVTRR